MTEHEYKEEIFKLNVILGDFNPYRIFWIFPIFLIIPLIIVPVTITSNNGTIVPIVMPIVLLIIVVFLVLFIRRSMRVNRELQEKVREINQKYMNRGIQFVFHQHHKSRTLRVEINRLFNNNYQMPPMQQMSPNMTQMQPNYQYSSYNQPNQNIYSDSVPQNTTTIDFQTPQYNPNQYNNQPNFQVPYNQYNNNNDNKDTDHLLNNQNNY